jgi:hypothetical protein
MRYLYGFLCVCALGVVPVAGCSEAPEWEDPCAGIVCDEENECTDDGYCDVVSFGDRVVGVCVYDPYGKDGLPCDFDGIPGRCNYGVCEEDLCEGVVCDDENACTDDECDWQRGCIFRFRCLDDDPCTEDTCDPDTGECNHTAHPDGTKCGCRWSSCGSICGVLCEPRCECIIHLHCENGECV